MASKSFGDGTKSDGTKGQITYQNRRQEDYATIGEGTIIVGGVVNRDLPGLNRDVQNSQIITQDTLITTPTINFDQGAWGSALGNNSSAVNWFNAGCSLVSTSCGSVSGIGTQLGIFPKNDKSDADKKD